MTVKLRRIWKLMHSDTLSPEEDWENGIARNLSTWTDEELMALNEELNDLGLQVDNELGSRDHCDGALEYPEGSGG